jgi:hypothetical protein
MCPTAWTNWWLQCRWRRHHPGKSRRSWDQRAVRSKIPRAKSPTVLMMLGWSPANGSSSSPNPPPAEGSFHASLRSPSPTWWTRPPALRTMAFQGVVRLIALEIKSSPWFAGRIFADVEISIVVRVDLLSIRTGVGLLAFNACRIVHGILLAVLGWPPLASGLPSKCRDAFWWELDVAEEASGLDVRRRSFCGGRDGIDKMPAFLSICRECTIRSSLMTHASSVALWGFLDSPGIAEQSVRPGLGPGWDSSCTAVEVAVEPSGDRGLRQALLP